MATVTALELDAEAAGYTGGEALHFGGFPGVWSPGQPVAVSELGFESEQDALDRARELELPLREVRVDEGSAPMPARPNHLANTDQETALDDVDTATKKRWTHAELDALAAEADVTWPAGVTKVDEKAAFLDAYAAGTVTSDGEPVNPDLEGEA